MSGKLQLPMLLSCWILIDRVGVVVLKVLAWADYFTSLRVSKP
jgi:hypothetical protein